MQTLYFAWGSAHVLGLLGGLTPAGMLAERRIFFPKAPAGDPAASLLVEIFHATEIVFGAGRCVYAGWYTSPAAWSFLATTGLFQAALGARMMTTGDALCLQVVSRELVLGGGVIHLAVAAFTWQEVSAWATD